MSWQTISPHFEPAEIFSPDILRARHWHLVNIEALKAANRTRKILDKPCHINHLKPLFDPELRLRGVVSAREVALRDGAKFTTHVQGHAFDISCYKVSIDELADAMVEAGFVTVYKYSSWCHGDMVVRGGIEV